MLWTVVVVLLILWALGMLGGHAFGGLLHVLIVIAVIVLVIRVLQGRSV